MSDALLNEVRELLRAVEALQAEQWKLLERKHAALRGSQADELLALATQEEAIARRLQEQLGRRQRILRQASSPKAPVATLEELIVVLGGAETQRLLERTARIRKIAEHVQRENRIQWVVARSVFHTCSGMLELLRNQGRPAPIYGKGVGANGGLLLDATV